jgi:hypothetical protein
MAHQQGIEGSIPHSTRDGGSQLVAVLAHNSKNTTVGKAAYGSKLLDISPLGGGQTCSRFFKKRNDPRRVTLESLMSPNSNILSSEVLSPAGRRSKAAGAHSVGTNSKHWTLDECIDSPGMDSGQDERCGKTTKTPVTGVSSMERTTSKQFPGGPRSSSVASLSRKKKAGPLDFAFQRQRRLSGQLRSPLKAAQPRRSVSRQRSIRTDITTYFKSSKTKENDLADDMRLESKTTSYYSFSEGTETEIPVPRPVSKRNTLFSQLQIDTNQTIDEFLWEGP